RGVRLPGGPQPGPADRRAPRHRRREDVRRLAPAAPVEPHPGEAADGRAAARIARPRGQPGGQGEAEAGPRRIERPAMRTLLDMGLANALTAGLAAVAAFGVSRVGRRWPALVHFLWLVVLIKLVTPPVLGVPLPWSLNWEPADDPPPA